MSEKTKEQINIMLDSLQNILTGHTTVQNGHVLMFGNGFTAFFHNYEGFYALSLRKDKSAHIATLDFESALRILKNQTNKQKEATLIMEWLQYYTYLMLTIEYILYFRLYVHNPFDSLRY